MTDFKEIYQAFRRDITDDMYIIFTTEDTEKDSENILYEAINNFEFPRCSLEFDESKKKFLDDLTREEISILGALMRVIWVKRQYYAADLIRMDYTGSDFKASSQANQLSKIKHMVEEAEQESIHKQRLYKRRIIKEGRTESNWKNLFGSSSIE